MKYSGAIVLAAAGALTLSACSGGAQEPAAASTPEKTAAAAPTETTSAAPGVATQDMGPGVPIEDYLLGAWWCKTTGQNDPNFFGMNSNMSLSLPEEVTFHADGRWTGEDPEPKYEWEYRDGALFMEYHEDIYFDLPVSIQIPSTVKVTSHIVNPDDNVGPEYEATTEVAFELGKMTMKTAEYTDPEHNASVSDLGETVTCRK